MTTAAPEPINDRSQLRTCPKCGALNSLIVSHCLNCGEFLPLPIGHPYQPGVPMPARKEGLSVPMILLIIAIILLAAMGALFLLAFSAWG